jgi:hypothetical protein
VAKQLGETKKEIIEGLERKMHAALDAALNTIKGGPGFVGTVFFAWARQQMPGVACRDWTGQTDTSPFLEVNKRGVSDGSLRASRSNPGLAARTPAGQAAAQVEPLRREFEEMRAAIRRNALWLLQGP